MDATDGGKPSSAPGNKADGVFRAPLPPPMPGSRNKKLETRNQKLDNTKNPLRPPTPSDSPLSGGNPQREVTPTDKPADKQVSSIKYQVSGNEPEGSDDIAIHTMQDDLAGKAAPAAPAPVPKSQKPTIEKQLPATSQPPLTPPTPSYSPLSQLRPRASLGEAGGNPPAEEQVSNIKYPVSSPVSGQPFPLPPRGSTKAAPVVLAPTKPKGRAGKVFLTLFILLLLLGGGGFAAWYFLLRPPADPIEELTDGLVADSSLILPDKTTLIIQYNLDSAAARAAALAAWQGAASETGESTLSGNPTRLIQDPELSQLFYVAIEDEARPFLVVPKTTQTSELFAGGVAVLEKSGWYIIHPVSTATYEAALASGTRAAQITQPDIFHTEGSGALRLEVSLTGLINARRSLISDDFAIGQLLALTLTGPLASTHAQLSGVGEMITPPTAGPLANEALLANIPPAAEFIRLGASLKEDIERWLSAAAVLNTQALASPQVQQLLAAFDTPYAFFSYTRASGGLELGLVTPLPDTLGTLALGDTALESALTSLTPLIAERINPSLLAFTDGVYQGIPLRYVNLVAGGPALDYAIHDNTLIIGTSKAGMYTLLDAVLAQESLIGSEAWGSLFSTWGALPQARELIAGRKLPPDIARLLPGQANQAPGFGFIFTPTPNGLAAEGVVAWGKGAEN